jgi:hypothetical protein
LKFEQFCKNEELPFQELGAVGGNKLEIDSFIKIKVKELTSLYESAIPSAMEV